MAGVISVSATPMRDMYVVGCVCTKASCAAGPAALACPPRAEPWGRLGVQARVMMVSKQPERGRAPLSGSSMLRITSVST